MGRRHHYRRSHHHSRDIGRERALQHIEDFRRLEIELGGSIEDVRQYFFSLSPHQLRIILEAYGNEHGSSARIYAERKIREWETGHVQMSGQTAERLFKLLPPRMPLDVKYRLIESLWMHVGPRSRKTLRIGLDARFDEVLGAVRTHMDDVVVHYTIPPALENRFTWLAAGDSRVKQTLLNHFQQYEKALVVDGARVQLPVMLTHLQSHSGQHTHRIAQILKIGNHELELSVDKNASGVRIVESRIATPSAINAITSYKWLWWVAAAIFILFLLTRR